MATSTLAGTIGFSQSSSCSDISVSCIPFSTRRLRFSSTILSPLNLQQKASGRRARPLIAVKMAAEYVTFFPSFYAGRENGGIEVRQWNSFRLFCEKELTSLKFRLCYFLSCYRTEWFLFQLYISEIINAEQLNVGR